LIQSRAVSEAVYIRDTGLSLRGGRRIASVEAESSQILLVWQVDVEDLCAGDREKESKEHRRGAEIAEKIMPEPDFL
jgi:hypothetical protein